MITSSGCPLFQLLIIELHSEYDEDAKHVEKLLHEYFKEKKTIGEWFELNVKDLIQIRNLFWEIEGENIIDHLNDNLKEFYNSENYCSNCGGKLITKNLKLSHVFHFYLQMVFEVDYDFLFFIYNINNFVIYLSI